MSIAHCNYAAFLPITTFYSLITTAQFRQLVGGEVAKLSDAEFEDLFEQTGLDPAKLLPGGRFRSQSNCDGTHFLVHDGPRLVVWPPKKVAKEPHETQQTKQQK